MPGALDTEQLRAELEKAKKRTKELATENVEFEDKVKELTKELEDVKKSKARYILFIKMHWLLLLTRLLALCLQKKKLTCERRSRSSLKKIQVILLLLLLSLRIDAMATEKDDIIKKLKKESEEKQVGSPGGLSAEKEAQMKQRLKELATENVDILKYTLLLWL